MGVIKYRENANSEWKEFKILKGDKGDTPVKGVDYWTESDIEFIKTYIDNQLGVIENGTY